MHELEGILYGVVEFVQKVLESVQADIDLMEVKIRLVSVLEEVFEEEDVARNALHWR